jgi:hypothetical protein
VQLLHDADDVLQVLDYVLAHYDVKGVVGEGIREDVEVPDDVGFEGGIDVEGDGAYDFAAARAYVEDVGAGG